MSKKLLVSIAGLAMIAFSAVSSALTLYPISWYGNPYSYTNFYSCTWQITTIYGGSWGSQFNYARTGGTCAYTTLQINHHTSDSWAQAILN